MTTPLSIATTDVDLLSVGHAWLQKNESQFAFSKIPLVTVAGKEEGLSGITTYDLVDLGFALNRGGGSAWWDFGIDPGSGEKIPTSEITIRLSGKRSGVLDVPIKRNGNIFADQKNPLPTRLSQLMYGLEYDLVQHLTNTNIWGSAKTFSGTALNTKDYSNQKPIDDIDGAISEFKHFKDGVRFKMFAIMDPDTLDILARRPEYHGAGEGSNKQGKLDESDILGVFRRTHRLDEIIVTNGAYNNAADGAAKTVARQINFLWIGIVDMAADGLDLTSGGFNDPRDNPDGALFMQRAPSGIVHRYDTFPLLGTERHMVTCHYGFTSPRASSMGCFWTGSEIRS